MWGLGFGLCIRNLRGHQKGDAARDRDRNVPLPSEFGTHKTVTARSWPWLSGKGHLICQGVASSLGSGTRMDRGGNRKGDVGVYSLAERVVLGAWVGPTCDAECINLSILSALPFR